jgi:hypothetical protein
MAGSMPLLFIEVHRENRLIRKAGVRWPFQINRFAIDDFGQTIRTHRQVSMGLFWSRPMKSQQEVRFEFSADHPGLRPISKKIRPDFPELPTRRFRMPWRSRTFEKLLFEENTYE